VQELRVLNYLSEGRHHATAASGDHPHSRTGHKGRKIREHKHREEKNVNIGYLYNFHTRIRMNEGLSKRLKEARKFKNLAQQELVRLAKLHYSKVSCYEQGEPNPASDILKRIAQVLEVTTYCLFNGTLQNKGKESIEDEELHIQFRKIEKLTNEKKKIIKELQEAFISNGNSQKQLAL